MSNNRIGNWLLSLVTFLLASCRAENASRPPPEIVTTSASPASMPAWKLLDGTVGSSLQWGSGWLDLETVRDFAEGTQLRMQVGSSARTIAIRLLGVDQSPDDMVGIIGQYDVPNDKFVTAKLTASYSRIKQISVHGKYAWNTYGDPDNGAATLLRVEIAEPKQQ